MTRSQPSLSEQGGAVEFAIPTVRNGARLLSPAELSRWLEAHQEAMAERWLLEIRSRSPSMDKGVRALLADFADLLTSFLAPGMGAYRDQVESIFQQTAELFGNLGVHRGQAAGEAVEEFQLLREVVLRFLYTDPPGNGETGIGLRDLLQLNRLVDLGVTYASVGHTDTLFFNLIHGTGVSNGPTPEVLDEMRQQVAVLGAERDRLLRYQAEEERIRRQ